tara:strand:- start:232 stop:1392 length:1161 start_codon:yes stop_codon:yes gene_type:complete
MSTIKVTNIEHGSTTDGGIQLDSSGHVTIDGQQLPTAGALSNRNLIINGAMSVAQRSTSETGVTDSGYKTVDRFQLSLATLGTYTVTQEADGPDGFSKSLKIDCTTADASPAADDAFLVYHKIEAQNLQHLNYGSSSAKALTLTFYVKSNKTGNASFELQQRDNSDRQVTLQYSINSANTWEQKTLSIPADASGSINDDNGEGLRLGWWLNSGSNLTGGSHQTTWAAEVNADRNVSNLGIGGSTDDYWQITGVQLEVGDKATPFEHRNYGDELARCQRYYQQFTGQGSGDYAINGGYTYNNGSSTATGFNLAVPLRNTPTVLNGTTGLSIRSQGSGYDVTNVDHVGWVENSVWVAMGVDHSDIGNSDHAATLNNKGTVTVSLDSEL